MVNTIGRPRGPVQRRSFIGSGKSCQSLDEDRRKTPSSISKHIYISKVRSMSRDLYTLYCPQSSSTNTFPLDLQPLLHFLRLINNGPLQLMIERLLRVQFIRVGEKKVDRFQSRSCRLWVECPYNHRIDNVEDREDDVGLISYILQRWRRDLDHNKVSQEVCSCCQGCALCADLEREYLRWVTPYGCHPA